MEISKTHGPSFDAIRKEKRLSIVVPMFNEEEIANAFYDRVSEVVQGLDCDYEVIFIDDGSHDHTLSILAAFCARDPHCRLLSFSRNFGHQNAVVAGLDNASGDIVLIIDADLQDPPELVHKMIEIWRAGYDVVYGKRGRRGGEGWFKLATAKWFYRLLRSVTNVDIPLDTGDFRLIDRKVVDAILSLKEENPFLRGLVAWVGFKQYPLEYDRRERYAGSTKYPLKRMALFALDGITSFSAFPLRIVTFIALLITAVSFLLMLYYLVLKIVDPSFSIRGWTSIIVLILFLGGIQLFSIGILGEYIGRTHLESKHRPRYIIDQKINFPE